MDIININAMLTDLVNNYFYLNDSLSEGDKSKEEQYKVMDRIQYWDIFKSKLKEFGGINLKIKEQKEKLDKLGKQVVNMENKKKKLEMDLIKSEYFLNYVIVQSYILIRFFNHIYKFINIKNKTISRNIFLLLNLIYINSKKENDSNEGEESQGK